MKKNIVLCYPVQQRHVERIAAVAGDDYQIIDAGQEHIAEEIFNADIFCGHAKVPVDWDEVVARGRLQWIQSSAAGMDHCLVPSVVQSPIHITSASGVLANQVAEHGMALALAFLRSLPTFFRAQQKEEFIRRPTMDLHGATVGIVGLGGVGRRLAEVLSIFGVTILAVDMFPVAKPAYVSELWGPANTDSLFAMCDVIFLCVPLNHDTRHLVNARRLSLMKPTALLVNISRGAVVDTDALVTALEQKQLCGAVMDVTDPEPLTEGHPLWSREDVIITPHVGGQCYSRIDDMTRMFCENLRRWESGEPLINYLSVKSLGFPIRDGGYPLWVDVDRMIS
ncbi:MAG: D-2-hydroxyacid dehydrogenase [Planctomycetia bacterium]|nr:D-2-hydroxyacid dehydrogenase [Planctomycetia bacterium]